MYFIAFIIIVNCFTSFINLFHFFIIIKFFYAFILFFTLSFDEMSIRRNVHSTKCLQRNVRRRSGRLPSKAAHMFINCTEIIWIIGISDGRITILLNFSNVS